MTKTWYAPSDPASIKPVPWLSVDAIAYLESILTPEMNVVEFGGGGSTLWFSKRVNSVMTYENNPEWSQVIRDAVGRDNINNVFLAYDEIKTAVALYDTMNPDKFYFVTVGFGEAQCDLLLIDGEPIRERANWILNAGKYVKPGGWVVLDNANRPEYAKERDWLQIIAELKFTSKLQGAHLVTEFYKLCQ